MKTLLLIVILCATPAFAQKVDQPKLREQLKALIKEQRTVLEQTENSLRESRETATTLFTELTTAKAQVTKVAEERDGWRDYGNDQHEKFMNAEKRVAEEKVAKLKWLGAFAGLLVLVLLYFGLKFLTPIGKFIP